jgi:hypothetical protein
MRRYVLLLFVLVIPALIAVACRDSVVDGDTATVTPRSPRDSVRLRDSTIYDTVDVPLVRNRFREGWIYFHTPSPDKLDSIPMVIDSFSYAEVEPGAVWLRAMARVPEPPPNLVPRGVPSWIYLYAERVLLGNDGRGEKPLQGDPRNDQTGMAFFLRPPFSGDLFVTLGAGHGRVMIDAVDRARRIVHANVKTTFTGVKPFTIDSITLKIGY